MGLHVGKVREELVDLSEAGAAIKGMDVIGGEGDGSGIGHWERHAGVAIVAGVML